MKEFSMPLSLAERLSTIRHHRFVGRTYELDLFRSTVITAELPFQILYIFAPGGVGKTSLLEEFTRICEQVDIPALYMDARNIEPTSEGFLSTLRVTLARFSERLSLTPTDFSLRTLASCFDRFVLLLDTYETLASLDTWLREEFLPQLSENTFIVLAGRHALPSAWRTDPGWQALLYLLPLRNLSPEESQTYLTKRAVPSAQHPAILDFTHGHPLALSLVADIFAQGQDRGFRPESTPHVVKALLEKFVQAVPTPNHRMALEACALVRLTTEALLAQMLTRSDVHELFEWLREQSFIESGQLGLFPHDLVREVLAADLRWRHPERYAELHQHARDYYITRLQQAHGQEQQHVLLDYIFLHRDNRAIRSCFSWQENKGFWADSMRESDKMMLLAMVKEHEGDASASLAARWLVQQPQGVVVFRDDQQQIAGFMMVVALHQASDVELNADPAVIATWRYLQSHTPLRQSEGATLLRFWMAQDAYQAISPIQSLIFIHFIQYHRRTPGLAFTFIPCAEPEVWAAMFAYSDFTRLTEADFEVGGRRYGVYGHDWRITPPAIWQTLLAQREMAATTTVIPASQTLEPLVVLSQSEFCKAVQQVLRQLGQREVLQRNPLLRSRIVVERAAGSSEAKRIEVLQALVREGVESLQSSPREAKWYRALDRTYLHPAPTQESAAELLDLPFGTFRRHLKAGIKRVAELLWQQEIS
jgi:hypothetical protein